jgi:hypothetical protein
MKVKEMLTTDEGVFEFVKQHLITQGEKSSSSTSCYYRNSSELSCAIGCLIEDQFYNDGLEFHNGDDPLVIEAVKKSLPNWVINKDMLLSLQSVHDEYEVEEWEWQLEILEKQLFHREELLEEDNKKLMGFCREI